MRNFRARTDAKAWTLRERRDPAQPSSSAYLAVYGWVRGTVARGLLRCICPLLAVRPEGADHQWRKIPPGELSIDPEADERLSRVTGRAGAS
jgi:hypothetical protein